MGSLAAKIAIAYVEAHPDQIVDLAHTLVDYLIAHIKASKPAAA